MVLQKLKADAEERLGEKDHGSRDHGSGLF